jgi:muramoyltetrapeptide carboxypeptidase
LRVIFPPPLAPGDLVAVVAPSSPFPEGEFWRGLAWLHGRYRIDARPGVLARAGYLAGSDERRARELARAMCHPDVKAIVAARGGYGATRILPDLPWDAFLARPKWIVGFSDVTALHLECAARNLASVHAPNLTGLGRSAESAATIVPTRAALLAALERPTAPRAWRDLTVVHAGRAEGLLAGGNLALVESMCAAGRLHLPDGAILVLEDVTERPYRLDRMLTALLSSGALARVSGIVFGEFVECAPGPDGVRAEEVLAERTRALGVPVVLGAPFGHGANNEAFVLGACARIDGGVVRIGTA